MVKYVIVYVYNISLWWCGGSIFMMKEVYDIVLNRARSHKGYKTYTVIYV